VRGGAEPQCAFLRISSAAAGSSFSFPLLALIRMLFRKILARRRMFFWGLGVPYTSLKPRASFGRRYHSENTMAGLAEADDGVARLEHVIWHVDGLQHEPSHECFSLLLQGCMSWLANDTNVVQRSIPFVPFGGGCIR
jgi:hypothetical protein